MHGYVGLPTNLPTKGLKIIIVQNLATVYFENCKEDESCRPHFCWCLPAYSIRFNFIPNATTTTTHFFHFVMSLSSSKYILKLFEVCLFVYFSLISNNLHNKNVDFTVIWTQIVGVEGKEDDHLTTTMPHLNCPFSAVTNEFKNHLCKVDQEGWTLACTYLMCHYFISLFDLW